MRNGPPTYRTRPISATTPPRRREGVRGADRDRADQARPLLPGRGLSPELRRDARERAVYPVRRGAEGGQAAEVLRGEAQDRRAVRSAALSTSAGRRSFRS